MARVHGRTDGRTNTGPVDKGMFKTYPKNVMLIFLIKSTGDDLYIGPKKPWSQTLHIFSQFKKKFYCQNRDGDI